MWAWLNYGSAENYNFLYLYFQKINYISVGYVNLQSSHSESLIRCYTSHACDRALIFNIEDAADVSSDDVLCITLFTSF